MKSGKLKISFIAMLASIALFAVGAGVLSANENAFAQTSSYGESYRNRLSYSAKSGWNNDPNGLLYADGVYHMYYQYTWDSRTNSTANWWDHMSWGHATSSDLVHWTEQPVAIPSYWDEENVEHMMFSGSAVYDGNNTSGLFATENGKVVKGQGIVAVLTQPDEKQGGQRQILAYSKDGGTSFEIYGEVLGANAEGSLGDGEFRDPKVFWNDTLGKWLMAVGGGSVRMYSSDNLKEWNYLGETGFWGECPDISRYETDGGEKYVLIISPEDKNKSHEYNGTNRVDDYYPSEYYAVGELDANGLFRATQPLKRLSEGIDSYAFQSFNNVPDNKVYGISWSASWLTVGSYEGFRESHNGGMTAACELKLVHDGTDYALLRKPVEQYSDLRKEETVVSGKAEIGKNPLKDVKATEADIEAELDFSDGATCAELCLRVSAAEKIKISYDAPSQILTLDRSESSLIAENTNFFKGAYKKQVALDNGKLNLRILLDRAFISVFANDGEASFFSAVFPSAVSDGMSLSSDGVKYSLKIYSVESIFGETGNSESLILSATKIDATVGAERAVVASSYAANFDFTDVKYAVAEGSENVSVRVADGIAYIKMLKKGSAKIKVSYKGAEKFIEVYVYDNGFIGNVNFTESYRAFSYMREDGLFLGAGGVDAFLFGDATGTDFTYSASFTPQANAQAGGLAFGYNGNPSGYWFVTADVKENAVKLVLFCGEKQAAQTLATAQCALSSSGTYSLSVTVKGGRAEAYFNGVKVLSAELENYKGGRVGLNVFNSDMVVNKVFCSAAQSGGGIALGEQEIVKIINVTDASHRLEEQDYSVADGKLFISETYLKTLDADKDYTFRIVTATTDFDAVIHIDFTAVTLTPVQDEFSKGENISFALSDNSPVYKVEINGVQTEFTRDGNIITVSGESLKNLTGGTHVLKAYTADGRPAASFKLAPLPDFEEDEVKIINRMFFWIDVSIFAALICGYAAFTAVKKIKAKKSK